MNHFFDVDERTDFVQFFHDSFTSFKAVHTSKFTCKFIHSTIIVHDIDLWQIMALTNQEVIRIVSWSDFNHTSTKFWVSVFVTNDWNWLVYDWKDYILTNQIFVTVVIWIDRHGNVTKHGFRTSRCHFKGT